MNHQLTEASSLYSSLKQNALTDTHEHWISEWKNNSLSAHRETTLSLSEEEKNWLKKKKTITMCVNPIYMPYQSIGSKGQHIGIAAEIIKLIAARIDTSISLYPTNTWMESKEAILQGRCDILPAAQYRPSPSSHLAFTPPYIISPTVIATASNQDFILFPGQIKDQRIGIVASDMFIDFIKTNYPNIDLFSLKDLPQGIEMLRHDELFGIIAALGALTYEVKKMGAPEIKISGNVGYDLQLAVAVKKQEHILHSLMTKAVASFTEEDKWAVLNKWIMIGHEPKTGYSFYWLLALIIAFIALMAIFFWNRLLLRQMQLSKKAEKAMVVARQKALDASRTKSDFLANMSHEIRTPMNAILGLAYLALQRHPEPHLGEYLRKINTAGQTLLVIVNDILDFSKIEAGKFELENTNFELLATLNHVTDQFNEAISKKQLDLIFDLDPRIPDNLRGDPFRLNQILTNLISNAIKFTERGEIRLSSRIITQTKTELLVRFTVADTGIGMTPEQQSRLFQAFSQADTSTTRKYGGTGLGLIICKRLVTLMGGEISIDSNIGCGSRFSFTVNLGLSENKPQIIPKRFSALKVLVVDDNEEACFIMQKQLRELSVSTDIANSGHEALALLGETDGRRTYDAILLDWRMAGMDGLMTAREIRRHSVIAVQPAIVIVSAYNLSSLQQEFDDLGIAGFLAKPTNSSMLFNLLIHLFAPEADRPHEDLEQTDQPPMFSGKRLLLVEDNDINQQIVLELLAKTGAQVDVAINGREAVRFVVDHNGSYDLILMDLQMPEMDGYQATTAIQKNHGYSELPIIAMTAHALKEQRQRCIETGMVDYIIKPIEPAVMYQTILRWLPDRDGSSRHLKAASEAAIPTIAENGLPTFSSIDLKKGLQQCGGNAQLYRGLLVRFSLRAHDLAESIEQAVADKDFEDALNHAHALKGVAGNLGAFELSHRAKDLENSLKVTMENSEIVQSLAAVKKELDEFTKSICEHFPDLTSLEISDNDRSHTPGFYNALYEELLQLVKSADGDTPEFIHRHAAIIKTWFAGEAWQLFQDHLLGYDFVAAQKLLENVQQSLQNPVHPLSVQEE
jgi:polar amino acid transport system substrate-binding protein